MSLIALIVVLLMVGFLCYLLQTAPIPVSPWFKMVIQGVIVIAVVIWLLQEFQILGHFPRIR